MNAIDRCPQCGTAIRPGSPGGLCPGCLLRGGLDGATTCSDNAATVAHGGSEAGSAGSLNALDATIGPMPRVLLPDADANGLTEPPLVRPRSSEMPGSRPSAGRYQLLGEIARGGMGAILKGRDVDLGRDLAVKVLLDEHRRRPELVRRFVEEAQICGQLQHPGIVPLYELGVLEDRRPFFSMKLVKGRTLAHLLDARTDPKDDLPRFLAIFEQVAQTMAYAHARGVIHRDLKPSNIMVGSFGEVQVMDWGLAKVLARGGAADDARAGKTSDRETVIATVRSPAVEGDRSQAGSVLGTPSYMAPEQARGELDAVDERADVFALGSILSELLTGQPAFTGRSSGETHRKAALGELTEAHRRLDASLSDPDLIALARDCLAREPLDRPRDAGAVAERTKAYLASVQERLRRAELAHVEERARRKLTTIAAASITIFVALAFSAAAWFVVRSAAREAAAGRGLRDAIAEAKAHEAAALQAPSDDLTEWLKAREAARRAESLIDEGEPSLAQRAWLHAFVKSLEREAAAAETRIAEERADRHLLSRLRETRYSLGDRLEYDRKKAGAEFARAFREYGIDLMTLAPADAGRRIGSRRIAVELAGMLDEWIFNQRMARDPKGVERLTAVAAMADPDPWRKAVRAAIARDDGKALTRLADTIDLAKVPPESAQRLAVGLLPYDAGRGISLLRELQRRYPNDLWITLDLASALLRVSPPDYQDAITFGTAAVALRPKEGNAREVLGFALYKSGRNHEAEWEFRKMIELNPKRARDRSNLSAVLLARGAIDEAIAAAREAVRLDPQGAHAHVNLSAALIAKRADAGAIAASQSAILLDPGYAGAHQYLGIALQLSGRLAEATSALREAARLKPGDYATQVHLGECLIAQGDRAGAAAAFLAASRLMPNDPFSGLHAALLLLDRGDRAGYRRQCARLVENFRHVTDPGFAAVVAIALAASPDAIDDWSPAIELGTTAVKGGNSEPWCRRALAGAYLRAGRFGEAWNALGASEPRGTPPNQVMLNDQLRALVLARLGRMPEARQARDRARLLALVILTPLPGRPFGAIAPEVWRDAIEYEIRSRELDAALVEAPLPAKPFAR